MVEQDPKRGRGKRTQGQPPQGLVLVVSQNTERDAQFRSWCEAIAGGQTPRAAALAVGEQLGTLQLWAKAPHRADMLADALERDVQRHLDILEALLQSEDDAKSIRAKAAVSQWLLAKKDRARFGEHRQIDQTTVTLTMGQEDSPFAVARDALALMSPAERVELARLASGEGDV